MSLSDFLKDPLGYAARFPFGFNERTTLIMGRVRIDEHEGKRDSVEHITEGLKPRGLVAGENRELDAEACRVYFWIWPAQNQRMFDFSAERTKETGPDPAYYLPYVEDAATSMTLGDTCDYFFTSSLSGCTVQVFGDPDSPTVTHANAASTFAEAFKVQRESLTGIEDPIERLKEANRRANAQVDTAINRMLPDPGARTAAIFRKSDYLEIVEHNDLKEAKALYVSLNKGQHYDKHKLDDFRLDLEGGRPTVGASVFGLRNYKEVAGWSIFCQAVTGVTPVYHRTKGIFSKTTTERVGRFRDEAVVGDVIRLFP